MNININQHIIGSNHTFIIAEASSNHGRDLNRAKAMIDIASNAGADAVKFQVFTANTIAADTDDERVMVKASEKSVFVNKDTKLIDLYRANELPRDWLPELASYAKEKNIIFLATPFDEDAVDQLEAIKVPAYKVASYELLAVPLLCKIALTKKPIIISTGMATIGEIEDAVNIIQTAENNQIILLHCSSIYPTPPQNINLRALKTIQQAFPDFPIGYSDHSLGIGIPIAAVALGANVIEKHFILDDGVNTVDDKFSLTPNKLKEMISNIRDVEKGLGSSYKGPSELEKKEKILARRSLWITKDIAKGEKLTPENIKCLRPGLGLSPLQYDLVLNHQASHDLKANQPLEWKDLML